MHAGGMQYPPAIFSIEKGLTNLRPFDILIGRFGKAVRPIRGEMAERLMALVLKTSDAERHRGFESLSLRHFLIPRRMQAKWRSTQVAEGAPLLRE